MSHTYMVENIIGGGVRIKELILSIHTFYPVSYTHLDVYKRQVQGNYQSDYVDWMLSYNRTESMDASSREWLGSGLSLIHI